MVKRLIFLIALAILFSFCSDKIKNDDNKPVYELLKVVVKDSSRNNNSFEIFNVEYPDFIGPTKHTADRMNFIIKHSILDHLGITEDELETQKEILTAGYDFLKEFHSFKKDFPETSQIWTYSNKFEKIFENEFYISFRSVVNSFTGGAHPNSRVTFFNFDKLKGESLQLDDVVTDLTTIRKIAEKEFRKIKHLNDNDDLSKNFNFPNDEFTLSENFGINHDGLILYYNNYEIAPYSEGPTQILINKELIVNILDINI